MSEQFSFPLFVKDMAWNVIDTIVLEWHQFSSDALRMDLIYDHVRYIRANTRNPIADVKDRAQVAWSNRKLFRQKGQWRWRQWELRSPTRRKWWVVFGPTKMRNFSLSMNQKTRKLATVSAFLYHLHNKTITVVDKVDFPSISTKKASVFLASLWLSQSTLYIDSSVNQSSLLSLRNISFVSYSNVLSLHTYSLLKAKNLVLTRESLDYIISHWFH